MKVSVVVPIYNQEKKYFDECLNSIVNQTVKPKEIIIIDDGSDKPVGVILPDAKHIAIQLFRSEKNRGIGWARGKGVELATEDEVCFF